MQVMTNSNTPAKSATRFIQSQNVSRAVSMSSREIAELVGKDHKNVIRDIRDMLAELEKDGSVLSHQFSESQDRRGYTTKFDLDRDLTETLITGYSITLRHKVIVRLRELESAVAEIAESKASRSRARLEAPFLSNAIKIQRIAIGKELAPHIFSNEFDLINRTVLGMSSKQYRATHGLAANEPIRDSLTPCQIFAIEHMQRLNSSLIDIGLPFDQRKGKLCQVFVLQHQRALISETMRIEA